MQAADQERLYKYRRRSDQIVFEAQVGTLLTLKILILCAVIVYFPKTSDYYLEILISIVGTGILACS